MGVSKVILNGDTLMDVTQDTVASSNLLSGATATGADGEAVTGAVASKTASDVTVSGATVTIPAGAYSSQVTKSVASGTAGTPTATKGTVSNHAVSVTPSVTNTAGYITGGTKSGTAVTVSASELVSGTLDITTNGDGIDVTTYASVDVDVEPNLGSLTVTPTESQQVFNGGATKGDLITSVTARNSSSRTYPQAVTSGETYWVVISTGIDSGSMTPVIHSERAIELSTTEQLVDTFASCNFYMTNTTCRCTNVGGNFDFYVIEIYQYSSVDGYLPVTVNAVPSSYVGSGVARKSSSDLTSSGATVSVPAGYYENNASKSVASGTAITPATTITANPTISVNSSGLITATTSKTQNVTPTVSAGYVSSGTAGTITVSGSATEQLTVKGAATFYPSTLDQSISSGQYLTGTQTIKAVTTSNLTAENIADGVTVKIGDADDDDRILSITGTHQGGGSGDNSYALEMALRTVSTLDPIASSLTSVGPYAFAGCSNLTTVSAPITSLGSSAFAYCSRLSSVSMSGAFTSIGSYAFASCELLTYVDLPNYTTSAVGGRNMFALCGELSVAFLSRASALAEYMFYGCSKLATVYASSRLSVGVYCFYNCNALTSLVGVSVITDLSMYAFYGCSSLTTLPAISGTIATSAFGSCIGLSGELTLLSTSSVGDYAFRSCAGIESTYFGYGLAYAGVQAFAGCTSLKTVTLLKGCFSVASGCFSSCYSLNTVYIFSRSLTVTGSPGFSSSAFFRCYNLLSLYLLLSSVFTLRAAATNVFASTPIAGYTTSTGGALGTIYVPESLYSSYISATNWAALSSRFVSMTSAEITALYNSLEK